MKMAVEAGLPGSENTEWARTKVADLYLENGNIDSASILYRSSLVYRENYPFALIGMARVERARKNYDGAIQYAKNAIQVLGESSFVAYLADLYELKGDVAKARETRNDVVALLEQSRKEEAPDAPVKHNVSRELATAYLNAGNLDKAMEYALADLKMRPDNIDANELMAWITYLKGDIANARQYADKMMATHTRNAGTLYKAGAIYAAAGDVPHGNELMQTAMTVNPNLDPMITSKVKPALVSIRQ
jgi:tetratricopeptide (TPR) repeat protein